MINTRERGANKTLQGCTNLGLQVEQIVGGEEEEEGEEENFVGL
jgi:hypothetical protein